MLMFSWALHTVNISENQIGKIIFTGARECIANTTECLYNVALLLRQKKEGYRCVIIIRYYGIISESTQKCT